MYWINYKTGVEITDINQIDNSAIGFVYLIEFTDGTKYIGKKNLYSFVNVKPNKKDEAPKGTEIIYDYYKNTGKGFRQKMFHVKKESNWKTYNGSSKFTKDKTIKVKYILGYANTQLELTYLEAEHLFKYEVLKNDHFLNNTILGSFYKSNLLN